MSEHYTVSLNLLDESFNQFDAGNYGLSVVLNETMFSCCILDFRRNKLLGLQKVVRNEVKQTDVQTAGQSSPMMFFHELSKDIPWLSSQFRLVKIAFEGKKSTLVPALLFDADEKEHYFRFNFPVEKDEQVCADHLMPMDAWNVFAVPGSVLESVRAAFPKSKVVHSSSLLIESVWINYKNRINSPHVFLHVMENQFDLMIFDGRQLHYFNTFAFQNSEDVAYYLIFVLEQLNFNPEKIPLVLIGNVEAGKELPELLQRYVRQVETGRRNEAYHYSYVLNQLPSQSFFPLLNFFSCGL
jgi:hypothetical protein